MKKRLLVVDDEPELAKSISRYAQQCDYETLFTSQSNKFKKLYNDFDPTMIVLDIVMPEPDGIEIVGWLREMSSRAGIIFISGFNPLYATIAEALISINGNKSVFLTKPIMFSTFRGALARVEFELEGYSCANTRLH